MDERTIKYINSLTEVIKYLSEMDRKLSEYTPSVSDTVDKYLDGILNSPIPQSKREKAAKEKLNSVSATEKEDEMIIEVDMPGVSMAGKPRKDGRWQGHVKLSNGIIKYIYGRSQQELYKNIQAYIHEGSPLPKQKPKKPTEPPKSNVISFADWVNKWLELYKKPNVKYNTYNCLVQAMKKVIIRFGACPLDTITTEELQVFFLSYTALRSRDVAITTTKMALEKARQQRLITYNPMDGVEIKAKSYVHRNALTIDEQQALTAAVKGTNYEIIFHVLLTTGLRVGEALALTDGDVDFDKRTVSVTKTAVTVDGKTVIQDSPKTAAGRRIVPVPEYVLDMLKEKTGQLFDFSYNSVRLFFARLSKKTRILFSAHILRHTYATRLEEAGVSPRLKQYLLGHASLEMTQNTYTDIQKAYIDKVNHQISSIFSPRSEQ